METMTAPVLDARIEILVHRNPGQMSAAEYRAVADAVLAAKPVRMLVFGCGRDSHLWQDLARPGLVVFVENEPKWAGDIFPVIITKYRGTVATWRDTDPLTTMDCWPLLRLTDWPMILIDGPRGDTPHAPGRLGPLALAAGYDDSVVIVHDCDRTLERECCDHYFAGRTYRTVGKLRIYSPKE